MVDAQTGAVNDNNSTPSGGPYNYWLPPDGAKYSTAYFVIDLGAQYLISQIDLFNTHNAGVNDRATSDFYIYASNSVGPNGANGQTLVGFQQQILLGMLPNSSSNPINPTIFDSATYPDALTAYGVAYQYLGFQVDGFSGTGAGLNEIRVYGTAIPEPASTVAWSALAALTCAWCFRRRALKT